MSRVIDQCWQINIKTSAFKNLIIKAIGNDSKNEAELLMAPF